EDGSHALHPEGRQLGRPQGAQAGAAEHVDAVAHRPQDLLVPDRGGALEEAVDDPDQLRPVPRGAVDVALGGRGQVARVEHRAPLFGAERGPREDDDVHAVGAFRPGTTIRTTGSPKACVRSTAMTRGRPALARRSSSHSTSSSIVSASWWG